MGKERISSECQGHFLSTFITKSHYFLQWKSRTIWDPARIITQMLETMTADFLKEKNKLLFQETESLTARKHIYFEFVTHRSSDGKLHAALF